MEDFIATFFLLYMVCGQLYMITLVPILTSFPDKIIKGEVVMAAIFLPFTILMIIVGLSMFITRIILSKMDSNRLDKWWSSPIRTKKEEG